jgi:prepilin-type N-terminal cleavage/methylation domain-containing protein
MTNLPFTGAGFRLIILIGNPCLSAGVFQIMGTPPPGGVRALTMKREKGNSLIEVLVALALLGVTSVLFLSGVTGSTDARVSMDSRGSAKVIAETVIDSVKKMNYDTSYNITVPASFPGYTANLTVASLANGNIQKLTIIVSRYNVPLVTLEDYKVNR